MFVYLLLDFKTTRPLSSTLCLKYFFDIFVIILDYTHTMYRDVYIRLRILNERKLSFIFSKLKKKAYIKNMEKTFYNIQFIYVLSCILSQKIYTAYSIKIWFICLNIDTWKNVWLFLLLNFYNFCLLKGFELTTTLYNPLKSFSCINNV